MVTSFKDLGKSTRELFDKHFKFGVINFEFKTKTPHDIGLSLGGTHDLKAQNVAGFMETKLKPEKGVSLKTKVDSAWVISSELEVEKKLHPDLSQELVATVETESGKKSLQLKNKFKHDLVNLALDVDFKTRYPLMTAAFCVPVPNFNNIVLGGQAVVDSNPFKLKKHVYAIGFKQDDLRLHAALTDHSNVDLNVYQEHKNIDLGFKLHWNKETRETSYGAAVQFKPSSKSAVKIRIDQNCLVGLSYRLKLDSDTKVTLCTEVDGKNLEAGNHRYGFAFEYDD